MARDLCPHYPISANDASGLTRCRACGVVIAVSTSSAVPPAAEHPGTKAAAGTQLAAAKAGITNVLHHPR